MEKKQKIVDGMHRNVCALHLPKSCFQHLDSSEQGLPWNQEVVGSNPGTRSMPSGPAYQAIDPAEFTKSRFSFSFQLQNPVTPFCNFLVFFACFFKLGL